MQAKENTRKLWLDALRGMAMLFVVLIHSLPAQTKGGWLYGALVSPIMIPLFFAVTGYVFKPCDGDQRRFYKGVFFKLVVPWFFLSLLPVHFLISILKGPGYLLRYIYLFVSGNRLWYIPCCIIAEILHFYVRKFTRKPIGVAAASALLCATGFCMVKMNICNFAMVNRAFIAQPYMMVGYICRVFEKCIERIGKGSLTLDGLIYVVLALIYLRIWPDTPADVHQNQYGSFLYFFLQVFLGCVIVFAIAKRIQKLPRALVYLGQNTYVCYALHGIIVSRWDQLLAKVGLIPVGGWISALTATLASCCFSCVAAMLINRWAPFMAGKGIRRFIRG